MSRFDLDGHKLNYHPKIVSDFIENGHASPIYAEISPSGNCNHRCIFCHYNYLGHKGFFKEGRMNSLLKEFSASGIRSVVFAGTGEPLLHPETVEAAALSKKLGMDTAISTNGTLLKDGDFDILANSLTWIRFSLNGGSPKNYAELHKAKEEDYLKVLANIKKLKSAKNAAASSITIGVQYILLPQNIDFVFEAARAVKEAGADYFVIKHFYGHSENVFDIEKEWPSKAVLDKLRGRAGEISDGKFSFMVRDKSHLLARRAYDKCYGLPFIIYIREDGEAYTCFSFQHDKKTSLGNVFGKTFGEVWNSRQGVLDYINTKIDKNKCQPNCRHHQINSYLWEIKHPSIEHINFI